MASGMDTVDSLFLQEPIHLLEHGLEAIQGTSQIVLVVGNPGGVEQQPLCRREVIEFIAEVWLDLSKNARYTSLGKCPQFARQLPLLTPPALDNDVHI